MSSFFEKLPRTRLSDGEFSNSFRIRLGGAKNKRKSSNKPFKTLKGPNPFPIGDLKTKGKCANSRYKKAVFLLLVGIQLFIFFPHSLESTPPALVKLTLRFKGYGKDVFKIISNRDLSYLLKINFLVTLL
jgi:hypothetical protein